MREAVIVSTARTALTKAGRGALNDTHGITMAGHAIKGALERVVEQDHRVRRALA